MYNLGQECIVQPRQVELPSYRHHKARNLAAVTINGKHIYLGPHNSPESWERYHQEIAKWLTAKNAPAEPLPTDSSSFLGINNLVEAYLGFAEKYYVSTEGETTPELDCVVSAVEPLTQICGLSNAHEFGPKKLKLVREHMIAQGWTRGTINRAVGRIKRMFKWGVEEELISPTILHGLQAVGGLRQGRTPAKESEPVTPVAEEHVAAILPYVTPQVADMLRLLLLTGMRPGEVTRMRPSDIDRAGDIWIFEPKEHKGRWRGHRRQVPLGPKAQEIVRRYLDGAADSFLFSPAEAEMVRSKRRREARKSPLTPSHRSRKPKPNGKRRPTDRYDTGALRRAIQYGIKAANKSRPARTDEIPHWSSNQIRHWKATEIRRHYGLDGAQLALGHKHADVTEIYAEKNLELAKRIAAETG